MTTTLNQIRSHRPCTEVWPKLLKHLGKTQGDDEPLSLLTILESNGLDDAIWCLRTEPTPDRIQRFALAIARRVEHLSPAAKACNDITEQYLDGTATKAEIEAAANAAAYAAHIAGAAAYAAAAAAYAAHAVVYATVDNAYAMGDAADAATYAAVDAANAAAHAIVDAATRATYAAEQPTQVQIFKEIFA
jgi:hypothetical protein